MSSTGEQLRPFQAGYAWKPGQSGNPAGRPKKGECITEILREFAERVEDGDELPRKHRLCERMWNLALHSDSKEANWIACYIIDRIDGKPRERIEQEGETLVRVVFDDRDKDISTPTETEGVLGEQGKV